MLTDGVHEAGNKKIARGLRAREKSGDDIISALAFPVRTREAWGIEKGAFGFAALEEIFLIETIERGHYGGIGKRASDFLNHVADAGLATSPENFHDAELEAAKGEGRGLSIGMDVSASFHEAEHGQAASMSGSAVVGRKLHR